MTEQEFFDACGHKGFSELQTEDGKTLRVLAYHIASRMPACGCASRTVPRSSGDVCVARNG